MTQIKAPSFLERASCGDSVAAEPASIKPISSIDTTAAPKDASFYTWFAYTGTKPLTLKSQGGSTLVLERGDKFGTRPSGNGKFIRLIGEKTGINKVFTLAFDDIASLIKNCKPTKAVQAASSTPRKVTLLFKDNLKNESVVCVTDERVWAFGVQNKNYDKGQPESLANFMFASREDGTAERNKAFKDALLKAMKATPVGKTGYAADVLAAAKKVTNLPQSYWTLLKWV